MMAYPFQLVDCYLIILVDQISRLFSITQTPDSIITRSTQLKNPYVHRLAKLYFYLNLIIMYCEPCGLTISNKTP